MALLDVIENGHSHVVDLQDELAKARTALDRTDAVLAVADDGLARAEEAIVASRRWGPVLGVALGVVVIGVVAVVILKRRRSGDDD